VEFFIKTNDTVLKKKIFWGNSVRRGFDILNGVFFYNMWRGFIIKLLFRIRIMVIYIYIYIYIFVF
jgi:hypothetical protein